MTDIADQKLNPLEKRTAIMLALTLGLRMFGLFLVVPILSAHSSDFSGSTPFLIGLAIGAYGLTQAVMQVPLGALSDRVGRVPVILTGLIIFAIGSVMAVFADTVQMLILARCVQGAGAIGSAVTALAADVSREDQRTKMMATIGMSIGAAFTLALIAGPILNQWLDLQSLFLLSGVLAFFGMVVVVMGLPDDLPKVTGKAVDRDAMMIVLSDKQLWFMNVSVLLLHALMTAFFVSVPLWLTEHFDMLKQDLWTIYLPLFLLSMATAVPIIIVTSRNAKQRLLLLVAVCGFALVGFMMAAMGGSWAGFLFAFWLFFVCFNLMEAMLPSLTSRFSFSSLRGTTMGVFATCQFSGVFLGGLLSGGLYAQFGMAGVGALLMIIGILWALFVSRMREPADIREQSYELLRETSLSRTQLTRHPGVVNAIVSLPEQKAWVKYDSTVIDEQQIREFCQNPA